MPRQRRKAPFHLAAPDIREGGHRGDIAAYWTRHDEARPTAYRRAVERFRRDMPFPELFPAFDRLLTDDRSRLWIRLYPGPQEEVAEWWILEEGRAVARLALEESFEVMSVSDDRIFGVRRDDLGVEYVEVLQVIPSLKG